MGTGLVLLGTLIAVGALVWELLARSSLEDARQLATSTRPRRRNPWLEDLDIRIARVTDADRQRYMKGSSRLYDVLDYRIKKDNEHLLQVRGSHPDVLALAEYIRDRFHGREQLLAKDWEDQKRLDDQLRAATIKLANDQVRLLVEDQRRRQVRVAVEMAGLALVAIGTMIGT